METILKKGTILRLPVKEIRTENKKSYFIVTYQDTEYAIAMFEFQKDEPKPELLTCIVKEHNPGSLVLIQDFSVIYKRFYTEGGIYRFMVRRNFTHLAQSYYEVADWNGLVFRLMLYGNAKLYEGQRIRCQVKSLVDNRLVLELVNETVRQRNFPLLALEDVMEEVQADDLQLRWAKKVFTCSPYLESAREAFLADDESWILQAIQALDENIDLWVKPGYRRNRWLLEPYHKLCLFLLEESDFLAGCNEQERKNYQKTLSKAAYNAEGYMKAIQLMEKDEHIRHIDILLSKMKKSGYLFKPDKRLRELMCIFTLNQELMQQKMQVIFEIILNGNKEYWRNEPFRSAFIEMLELYITDIRKKIDKLANVEDEQGRQYLERIIKALAIQLLMANETDDFDRQLSLSMLYRYLTYVEGGKQDVLLDKSFRCLSETGIGGLGFGWNELNDLTLLAIKLSSSMNDTHVATTSITQTFQGKKGVLYLTNGNIRILSNENRWGLTPQIPTGMLPWNHIQIEIPDTISTAPALSVRNLTEYRKWWREIEDNIFNDIAANTKRKNRKFRPDKGEVVYIRITGFDPADEEYLLCTIEDGTYEGQGRIHSKQFVRYNLRMEMDFFLNGEGRPYLLQAKVIGVEKDGSLLFSMQEQIFDHIRQCLSIGDITRCVVMEKFKGYYLCISEYGYSLQVPAQQELQYGNYIEVQIDTIRSNGNIEGTFLQQILNNFRVQDAFSNLMYSYAGDMYYEGDDEKEIEQQEVQLELEYVLELIHIIDRKAVLDQDYIRTFNYLQVARIIALLADRNDWADYYSERMKLLQMFQDFAINGKVDNAKLCEQNRVNGDMIRNYPLLQIRVHELQSIDCIGKPEQNEFLWKIIHTTPNLRLKQIARLVLSYNMLEGFNLHEERESIKSKLNEILKIEMKTESPRYFGREDLHTEFKSSLVYPAGGRLHPDLKAQTHVILKEVCGFLNAEGGTLYLGVNDEGVACGIEEDLPFFKNSSLDAFDLHVRNHIATMLGVEANSYVKTSYPDAGKYTVYAIEIQPSPFPVQLEEVHYVRQGSSTWPVLGHDLELFLQRKENERKKLGINEETVLSENLSALPVEQEKELPSTVERFSYHDDTQVSTSKIRQNAVHDWEDGYGEDTLCFFHLMPKNEYMLTEEQCWEETLLSLAVHERESNGYIVLVYSSGRIIKVPVAELMDKTYRKKYKRNSTEDLVFACPATDSDALLTIVKDNNDNHCYRLDDISGIKSGNMSEKGELMSNVYLKEVVQCDIIPNKYHKDLKRIHNLRNTNLGNMLTPQWAPEEINTLTRLGIIQAD